MSLEQLKQGFTPKRTFSCNHTKIEVDGVFVRISDEEEHDWLIDREKGTITLPTEDILQDPSVVRSARVSTGRDTKAVDEKATGMINSLWQNKHATPFEGGVHFRLKITTPIMYAQPFFRIFASHNEFSGRYSKIDGQYYTPNTLGEEELKEFQQAEAEAQELYRKFSNLPPDGFGIANEMARLVHLYRFYTKFYMTISLRHVMEFLTWENFQGNRYVETEFDEIKSLLHQILETWTPWSSESLKKTPNNINFYWTKELADRFRNPWQLPFLEIDKFLDKGEIRLLETYGKENLMFACLDDFPNPLRGFGHGGMTFLMRIPIHVFRQWVRHRFGTTTELGFHFDDVVENNLFYIPTRFRKQVGKPMQYQFEECNDEENEKIRQEFINHTKRACARYVRMRENSVPDSLAGMILPYCFYVPVVITYPVEALINFLSLRLDIHAQAEIREPAKIILEMFRKYFPEVAFQSHNIYLPK
ncbi:MAG: FAD-dependent thymidylate synthase [Candidatus Yanofskybacteria bacterium]|nr:FAD-dependent thymidylate synthase [Candidatus Yanofskybacteria bacterium]